MTTKTSTQYVYRGHGDCSVRIPTCDHAAPIEMQIPTIADSIPATWIMSCEVVCAREDLEVDALVELMAHKRIGCVPIVDHEGCPVGMVTKQDLVELLRARQTGDSTSAFRARELMMPIAFTLDEHATIAHVAAMMTIEGVHHVPIVSDIGCVIGVVSTFDVVRWLASNDGVLRRSAVG